MEINGIHITSLDSSEELCFSHSGCDNCNDSLAGDIYYCKAWFHKKEKFPDYFEIQLCSDCLYAYYYGDEVEKYEDCEDIYNMY